MNGWLGLIANISAIATAIVALGGYGYYRWDQRQKRLALEAYLKRAKLRDADKSPPAQGQRSHLHIVARVGLTESEILHASFNSPRIRRVLKRNPKTKLAETVLFEYVPTPTAGKQDQTDAG